MSCTSNAYSLRRRGSRKHAIRDMEYVWIAVSRRERTSERFPQADTLAHMCVVENNIINSHIASSSSSSTVHHTRLESIQSRVVIRFSMTDGAMSNVNGKTLFIARCICLCLRSYVCVHRTSKTDTIMVIYFIYMPVGVGAHLMGVNRRTMPHAQLSQHKCNMHVCVWWVSVCE